MTHDPLQIVERTISGETVIIVPVQESDGIKYYWDVPALELMGQDPDPSINDSLRNAEIAIKTRRKQNA